MIKFSTSVRIFTQLISFTTTNKTTNHFMLPSCKEIVFHGVNAVKKEFPYIPTTTGQMDYNTTIVDADI